MQDIIPMLSYEKGVESLEWLKKVFGFKENIEMRMMEGDRLTHAELKAGDNIIMLATPSKDYISIKKQLNQSSLMNAMFQTPYIVNGLLVYVDNVDTHFETAKQNGAEILSAIEDGFPGKRYRCADIEGHRWMFMEKEK
ncbi:MAG: VOC family protein [Ginsengibacter sp.]